MVAPVLYEDDRWLVVIKPTDLASHAPAPGSNGLLDWLQLHGHREIQLCSRLDKGTSGVMVLAKSAEASRLAQQFHETEQSSKTYHFLSHQRHPQESWQDNTPLDGKPCQTRFRFVAEGNGLCAYEATISRGRTHQIRRHAAQAKIPLLGDELYGGQPFARLALHCVAVHWPGISTPLTSPVPDSFTLALDNSPAQQLATAVAWERRLGWPLLVSNSLRLIHRGELSAEVSIDLYHHTLLITSFTEQGQPTQLLAELQPTIDYLSSKLEIGGGLLRYHSQNPHQRRLSQGSLSWGSPQLRPTAQEHDLCYHLDLEDRCHAGLFLDQRDSRQRLANLAKGKRLANLFAFTCSFSVVAAAAQAEVVFSVDLAGSSLERGKANFALNKLDKTGQGKFIQEDVLKWLARQLRKLERDPSAFPRWGLIICDPPVFASAGGGNSFHVEKQWPELVSQIRQIMAADGVALFANNHRGGDDHFYQGCLEKHFSKVTATQPPLDFPGLPGQPPHVRLYWCEA